MRVALRSIYAAESAFYAIVGEDRERERHGREVYRTPEPIPLQELLEEAQEGL